MITIRDTANTTDIFLPSTDHVSNAEDAARHLWAAVFEHAKAFGGAATLTEPDQRREGGWAVRWHHGPSQWADAYVVSEGADALGFVAMAENGDTVTFRDTD